MMIHWEEVKQNSHQIDEFNYQGKYWREFIYEGENQSYTWFAYDIDNPYQGNPLFREEGYTPRRKSDPSPSETQDIIDTEISYIDINEYTGYSEFWIDYEWKYLELYDEVGEYIDYAFLDIPENTSIDTKIFVNDNLIRFEDDYDVDFNEGSSLKYNVYPSDSFKEDLKIKIENNNSLGYSEVEEHFISTSVDEDIYINFSDEEYKMIEIPITFESGHPVEYVDFKVINYVQVENYPRVINKLLRIESDDFTTTDFTFESLPMVSISIPYGFQDTNIKTKWIEVNEGYELVIDGDYYYSHENKVIYDHKVSGEAERFEDSFPIPMDYSQNVGSLNYSIEMKGVFDIRLNISQDIGNFYSLKGKEDSLFKVKNLFIKDYEYFNQNKKISKIWTQEEIDG